MQSFCNSRCMYVFRLIHAQLRRTRLTSAERNDPDVDLFRDPVHAIIINSLR